MSPQDPQGELAFALARAGLSVISLHTNWDAAPGGTNDALAGVPGCRACSRSPREAQPIGRVGQIIPSTLGAFAVHVKGALGSRHFLVVGDPARSVGRVALCGGEGSDFLLAARGSGRGRAGHGGDEIPHPAVGRAVGVGGRRRGTL